MAKKKGKGKAKWVKAGNWEIHTKSYKNFPKKARKKKKILKDFPETSMITQLKALRSGRPKMEQGLLGSRIGGFMKEKFRFKKDRELVNQYNKKINEANKILTKLVKRLR